jgi:uncharacterized protein DUF1064
VCGLDVGESTVNKFNAKKVKVDGYWFDSGKEAHRYTELKMLLRSRIITDLEVHKSIELKVNGVKICDYEPDFVYKDQSGREVIEDVKGYKKGAAYQIYRLKAKLMIACHGLRVVEL